MKNNKLLYAVITILFLSVTVFAQNEEESKSKCDCTECHQFDFWIGKWRVEWEDKDGTKAEGTNTINSILDGCVIEENFDGNPAMEFRGKSFSVYNHGNKMWQQTWVDTEGAYMLFSGGMEDDKMILSRKINYEVKEITQRMVFYNISENAFDWNWEALTDDGENWKLNWKIRYTRI